MPENAPTQNDQASPFHGHDPRQEPELFFIAWLNNAGKRHILDFETFACGPVTNRRAQPNNRTRKNCNHEGFFLNGVDIQLKIIR